MAGIIKIYKTSRQVKNPSQIADQNTMPRIISMVKLLKVDYSKKLLFSTIAKA